MDPGSGIASRYRRSGERMGERGAVRLVYSAERSHEGRVAANTMAALAGTLRPSSELFSFGLPPLMASRTATPHRTRLGYQHNFVQPDQ